MLAKPLFSHALSTGLCAAIVICTGSVTTATAKSASLYGQRTVVLSATKLDKWRNPMLRHRLQTKGQEWRDIVARTKSRPRLRLVLRVHEVVNKLRYVPDPNDQWRTPTELVRSGGDCEDYAIAKYLLLREHGVPASSMRIVVLSPSSQQRAHAVLIVDTANGPLVLDNLRARPYSLSRAITNRISYAVNEANWWVNVGGLTRLARR